MINIGEVENSICTISAIVKQWKVETMKDRSTVEMEGLFCSLALKTKLNFLSWSEDKARQQLKKFKEKEAKAGVKLACLSIHLSPLCIHALCDMI